MVTNGIILERIERKRKEKGTTQRELEKRIRVVDGTLAVLFSRLRKNKVSTLNIIMLYRISSELDCTIDYLFGREDV